MKEFLDRKISIHFDWSELLAFVTFFVYGLYGAIIGPEYPAISNAFTIVATLLFLLLLLLPLKTTIFHRQLQLPYRDLIFFCFYLSTVFCISFHYLRFDITIDQLFHAYWGIVPSVAFVEMLGEHFPSLQNSSFKTLTWITNVTLLALLVWVWHLIKIRKAYALVILVLLFILGRVFVYHTFGGTTPHPQFRLFPIMVSSAFFGINNIAFRMASLIGLALLMMQIHGFLRTRISPGMTVLSVLCCGTIPVLIHTGTLVEPSIWAALYFTFLLIHIYEKKIKEIDVIQLMALFTLFFLMRQSVIAVLPLLAIIYLYQQRKHLTTLNLNSLVRLLLPWMLILPMIFIFLKSIYVGTPGSTEVLTNDPAMVRVGKSIFYGVFTSAALASFHFPLLLFFVLAFIPFKKTQRLYAVLAVLQFTLLYVVFFSASSKYWGSGRYLAEFVVPFIVLGTCITAIHLHQKTILRIAGALLISGIFIYNTYSFLHLDSYSEKVVISYPTKRTLTSVVSARLNNHQELLSYLKEKNAASKTLFADEWIYYNLPFIMNGYTVKECLLHKNLLHRYVPEKEFDLKDLQYLQNKISYIIFDPVSEGNKKNIQELLKNGWHRVPVEFNNSDYWLLTNLK